MAFQHQTNPEPAAGLARRRAHIQHPRLIAPSRGMILTVDDDPDALTLLRVLLRSAGFDVQEALSGRAALQCVRQKRPDLIITDLHMPDMGGEELCRILRDSPETRRIPIIVHSGETVSTPQPLYDRVFLKPVELKVILSAVHRLLAVAHFEKAVPTA